MAGWSIGKVQLVHEEEVFEMVMLTIKGWLKPSGGEDEGKFRNEGNGKGIAESVEERGKRRKGILQGHQSTHKLN